MSSQTPNINLTLPTGAEKVSRQIINDNNTKIDTAVGELNSKITGIHTTIAVSNGVGSISDAAIKTTSAITIQIHREDTSGYVWENLKAYPRCTSDGSANIYIRKEDGTLVSGNMIISAIIVN